MPTIGGVYRRQTNDDVHVSRHWQRHDRRDANLTLEVKNSSGSVVASLNVGQGYEPGSALQVVDGVSVRLGAGTANDGDTFTAQVVADADTAGILPVLGLNSFFTGHDAGDIHVRNDLISNPGLLAASARARSATDRIC